MKKETSKYHNVFYEEKNVCNKGRARYQLDLTPIKKFPASKDLQPLCVFCRKDTMKELTLTLLRSGERLVSSLWC